MTSNESAERRGLLFPERSRRAAILVGTTLAVAAGVSYLFPSPWLFTVWVAALAFVAFVLCWVIRAELLRNLALAAGVILLMATGLDLYLGRSPPVMVKHYQDGFRERGFGVLRDRPETFRVYATPPGDTGTKFYDVAYTFDEHGNRLTTGGGKDADTYLFFGDSFTFGEGVENDETFPQQFSNAMGGGYTVLNLAYSGFGPQHMLRQLETRSFAGQVTGKVRRAFFLTIPDHLNRVVGTSWYRRNFPRYTRDADGRAEYRGTFWDNPLIPILSYVTEMGGLPSKIALGIQARIDSVPERIALTGQIFAQAAEILKKEYGVELVILVWDRWPTEDLDKALAAHHFEAIRLSQLFGDYTMDGIEIKPGIDGHPTGKAHGMIARFLADRERAGDQVVDGP